MQGPVAEIDNRVYHDYIVGDKAMKVRMPRCELKWKIPILINIGDLNSHYRQKTTQRKYAKYINHRDVSISLLLLLG